MDVFISSLIGGMESLRDAGQDACETLRHHVIRAEHFGATSDTPQQACLQGVRASEILILILGSRYGHKQESGLSATHEEYREARDRIPVLVFIQDEEPEPAQAGFIKEVQDWSSGHFTVSFSTIDELKVEIIRGLHDSELAKSVGSADPAEILDRVKAAIPLADRYGSSSTLHVAVAGGPQQQVIRPSQLEEATFQDELMKLAMFGEHRLLDPSLGTDKSIIDGKFVISQNGASMMIDELGTVAISVDWHRGSHTHSMALIEEDVLDQLEATIRFIGTVLDNIDARHRLSDVAVVAHQTAGGFLGWQTRAEAADSGGSVSFSGQATAGTVELRPPSRHRAALLHEARPIAEDLMVLIRRQIRGEN